MIKSISLLFLTFLALNLNAQLGESRYLIESRMGTPYQRDTFAQSLDITYLYQTTKISEVYILTFSGRDTLSVCTYIHILRHSSTLTQTLNELNLDSNLTKINQYHWVNLKLGTSIKIYGDQSQNHYFISISSI